MQSAMTIATAQIMARERIMGTSTAIEVNPNGGSNILANVHIDNIVFYGSRRTSIEFYQVNRSSVTNCTFIGAIPGHSNALYGIQDLGTRTGYVWRRPGKGGRQRDAGFAKAILAQS